MVDERSRITQGQLMYMVLQTQIGVGVLSLPFDVQQVAKGGGWISVLFAGAIVQVIIVLLCALGRRFPSRTLYDYLPRLLGRVLGTIMGLAYTAYFLNVCSVILVFYLNVISRWILTETPKWALLAITVLTGMYMVRGSLRSIARFAVAMAFLIVILLTISLYSYTVKLNPTYIFPITEAGWMNIIKGSHEALLSMLGFELILVIYPFVEGKASGKLKALSAGNLIATMLYTFLTFTALIIFSPQEIQLVPEPVLYMLKAFSLQVVERLDLIFMTFWSAKVITTFTVYMFLVCQGLGQYFHQGDHKKAVFYVGVLIFILSMIPQNQADIELYNQLISLLSYVFIVGLPLLFLLLSYILKRKEIPAYEAGQTTLDR
ncbi:GerAB/ArcD/ProY family transporter [Lihuaxuella thermophila]|uniref:Spore germination protein (Amino acid permease) n=1 Tax=Lihuaxuella thermophila TaxID=1173111 RepID=A0A1H8HFN0_9BACL|nr:GerAB/ArcD/ProY family transporter [Lihuaxuella thermophila]SEN55032.1 spore germination protein (amino acid permease) [Lihuaxuella thermophila]